MLQMWLGGVEGLLQFRELAFLGLGMFIGLFFGAIPGLGGAAALALLMPLTYGLEPFTALALSGGVMGGVPMGGSITAILLNTPGSAPNAATAIDGYPLAQQGKAGLAIGAAASANAIGGIIGTVSVLAILPIAKDIVLLFGPPEFFLLALLGLVIVSTTSRGKLLRGLITGAFGLMVAFIGYNDVSGGERFTYGIEYLWDGVHLVPALIGLFAVAEMINLYVKGGSVANNAASVKITKMTGGLMRDLPPLADGDPRLADRHRGRRGAGRGRRGRVVPLLQHDRAGGEGEGPRQFRQGQHQGRDRAGSGDQRQGLQRADPDARLRHSGRRRNGGVHGHPDRARHAAGAADAGRSSGGDLRPDLGADRVLRAGLVCRAAAGEAACARDAAGCANPGAARALRRLCRAPMPST